MLLGISRDEDNHIAYTYNADGLRSQQVVTKDGVSTTTKYIWGNHGLAAVITDERTVVLLYDDEGEAVGFYVHEEPQPSATLALGRIPIPKQTDFVYTYVKNLQGDVIQIIDEDGDAVVKYTYDPWGAPTVHGDDDLAAINPCSYRGYYYDEETGYYYLRSRYYDPEIGRFINADDIGALGIGGTVVGLNLVLYCENCPIAEDDQSGYGPILAFGIQFTITIGKLTLGLEALWKQSSRQFYLFGFIGGTRTIDLAFLKSKEAGVIPKILSLLRSLTKLSLSSFSLFKGLGISVSFIVVLGNRYASFPRSYCGWFTGFSASFYHVAISGAYAVSGKMGIGSVGIGVTSSAASIGLSQTYYFQLTGNDALANNLAEAKTSIYNKVAWLRLFGFWH